MDRSCFDQLSMRNRIQNNAGSKRARRRFLVSHGLLIQTEAQAAIRAGRVAADGRTVAKAAQKLDEV